MTPHSKTTVPRRASEYMLAALFALALGIPAGASAAERVGRVLAAAADVSAERSGVSARSLDRGDSIYAGDTIRTGPSGRVQFRFRDGGMVDLEPNSYFRVDEYATKEDGGGGNVVMTFLRGAMRTITGAIGSEPEDNYEMNTTVATIGIRGTAYALGYCEDACVAAGNERGLYGRVDDGMVAVTGASGNSHFRAGQFFFVGTGDAPRRVVVPPDGVLEGGHDNGTGDDRNPAPAGGYGGADGNRSDLLEPGFSASELTELEEPSSGIGNEPDPTEPTDPDPVELPGTSAEVVFGGAFFGGDDGTVTQSAAFISPGGGDARLDGDGAVVAAEFPDSGIIDASEATLAERGSTDVPVTGDSDFSVEWGRWAGSLAIESGSPDAHAGGFAFAYTDAANLTPTSILSDKTDQLADYSNFSGPSAVATSGELWDLAFLDLSVDFQADEARLSGFDLQRSDGNMILTLDALPPTGTVDDATSSVILNNLDLGSGAWSGAMEGRFVGGDAEAIIMRFDIVRDDGTNTITGVTILQSP